MVLWNYTCGCFNGYLLWNLCLCLNHLFCGGGAGWVWHLGPQQDTPLRLNPYSAFKVGHNSTCCLLSRLWSCTWTLSMITIDKLKWRNHFLCFLSQCRVQFRQANFLLNIYFHTYAPITLMGQLAFLDPPNLPCHDLDNKSYIDPNEPSELMIQSH